jgi:flagellar protein FlaG
MKIDTQQVKEMTKLPEVNLNEQAVLKNTKLDAAKVKEIIEKAKSDKEKLTGEVHELDPHKLQELVDSLNQFMLTFDQTLKFRLYEDTNQLWVRVIDTETDRVIREIPSQDTLKLAARIKDFVGLLIDEYR